MLRVITSASGHFQCSDRLSHHPPLTAAVKLCCAAFLRSVPWPLLRVIQPSLFFVFVRLCVWSSGAYLNTHTQTRVCVCASEHLRIHRHMHTHTCTHVRAQTHTQNGSLSRTHTITQDTHTHIHTDTQSHRTHTHIHTGPPARFLHTLTNAHARARAHTHRTSTRGRRRRWRDCSATSSTTASNSAGSKCSTKLCPPTKRTILRTLGTTGARRMVARPDRTSPDGTNPEMAAAISPQTPRWTARALARRSTVPVPSRSLPGRLR